MQLHLTIKKKRKTKLFSNTYYIFVYVCLYLYSREYLNILRYFVYNQCQFARIGIGYSSLESCTSHTSYIPC